MELKQYLEIMVAKRWLVLATFLTTFGAALFFTLDQPPVYRSVARYVVKTSVPEQDTRTLAAALEVLSRGQVGQTIAEVAASHVIKVQTSQELGLSSKQVQTISVGSRLLGGTNVVEITVEGPYPALARDFASTVGRNTATFVQNLYGMYALEMLDQPTAPSSPARPQTVLNLLLGAVAGLALGLSLAFLSAYLHTPSEKEIPQAEVAIDEPAKPEVEFPEDGKTTAAARVRPGRTRADAAGADVLRTPA